METCKEEEGRALVLPFTYTVTGSINGEQVEVVLEGKVSPGEVRFETTLVSPKQPLLWDEAIVALVALDPLLRLAMALTFDLDADELADELADAVADEFRVESSLYRECDLPVGRFVLVGVCSLAEGRVAARGQLVEGWLGFEPGERVTGVGERHGLSVLAGEPGRVVATRTWSIETSRGNSYSGCSVMRGRRFDGEVVGQSGGTLGVRCSSTRGERSTWVLEVKSG